MSINEKYGLPATLRIGSNTIGPHPASRTRPAHHAKWSEPSSKGTGYRVSSHMIHEPPEERPKFKVLVLGAGAAGIDFLHHIKAGALDGLHGGVEVLCIEKNSEVGGTWYENRYPGCACDVPSASYSFSWKSNPDWSSYYSGAKEIWQYLKDTVDEEGLGEYIKLNTQVVRAVWDDDRGKWQLDLKSGKSGDVREWTEECDLFLNGTGFLNAWKWPDIAGFDSYKGKLFHTANYDPSTDLRGKRVAVIGSGSSGVQIIASIYDDVSELYTWIRSPIWITAGFAQKFAGPDGKNFQYTKEQKEAWRQHPEAYIGYRKMIERELNQRFKFVLSNTEESEEANAFAYKEMMNKLEDHPRLVDRMIPKNFNVGCRRPTPGNGYLEALTGEKTTYYTDGIRQITPRGFIDPSGQEIEVDVIVCATGFDTSFRPRFPIIGLNGVKLNEQWKDHPSSYISVGVANMPNYFTYSGPFTPVAQGSVLPLLTLSTKYFLEVVRKMQKQHIRRIVPKQSAVDDFMDHAQTYLRRTTWSGPCTSWFKQGRPDGEPVMWPGSRLAFFALMEEVNWEDYDIEYWNKNRWAWLGSGFSTNEFDGSETAYYLDLNWQDATPKGLKNLNIQRESTIDIRNDKLSHEADSHDKQNGHARKDTNDNSNI